MSEEEIKQLIKEEMLKTIKNDLHSEMIFTYVDNLEKENKQLKETIDKAIEYIKKDMKECKYENRLSHTKLLELLGDKENENIYEKDI